MAASERKWMEKDTNGRRKAMKGMKRGINARMTARGHALPFMKVHVTGEDGMLIRTEAVGNGKAT